MGLLNHRQKKACAPRDKKGEDISTLRYSHAAFLLLLMDWQETYIFVVFEV